MFLNINFDFVHRWNAQLAELTEQRTGLAEFAQIKRFQFSGSQAKSFFSGLSISFECMCGGVYCFLTEIVRSAPVVKFT